MDTDLFEIINLLRRCEVNIINGSSKLCLTASILHGINLALQEAECNHFIIHSTSTVEDNIKFLCNIISKVPKLVITQKINSVKYRLDISRFINLKYLELNNIPVHLVEGIHLFRLQIQVLVFNNVSASLNDIFGTAGVWDNLHTAKLCSNNFESLSQSTSISLLQHLDLSYNRLKGEIKLQSVNTLKYLNLSFNCLTSLPVLSKDSYYSLKVIRLNNNFIEYLTTLHQFSGLEILDLSYNLITDHSVLSSMGLLLNLQSINLSNNPISYHPYYRVYFCHSINGSLNLDTLIIDERPLSAIEKREVIRLNYPMLDIVLPKHGIISPSVIKKKSCSVYSLKSIPKKNIKDAVIGNCLVNKKRSNWSVSLDTNTRSLQNEIDIEEFSFRKRLGENLWSLKLCTSRVDCGMGFKFESITSRTLLNNEHHPLPKFPPTTESLQLTTRTNQLDHPDNDEKLALKGQSIESIIFNNEDKMLYFENFDKLYKQLLEFGINPENLTSPVKIQTKGNKMYDVEKFETCFTEKFNEDVAIHDDESPSSDDTFDEDVAIQDDESPSLDETFDEDVAIQDDESPSSDETFDELLLAQKQLQDGSYLDVFITLNECNIKEISTVTGRILKSWSLRSVESCEKLMTNPSTIRLVFNNIRKDSHERIYVIENPDADKFLKRIRLFLETRSLRSMNQTVYRCLKCNSIFSRELQQRVLFPLTVSKNVCKKTIECLVCGSALVVIEEDVLVSKHVEERFSIATNIESTTEEEFKRTGKLTLKSSPVNDSDIEVISNPSQSSIEVLEIYDQDKAFPAYSSTRDELKSCVQNTESDSESNTPVNVSRRSIILDALSNNKVTISRDNEEVEKIPTPNTYTSMLECLIYCATAKFIPVNRSR